MENIRVFDMFAKKAAAKIEAKKKLRTKTLHIGALDEDIEIRALTDQEFIDCSEYSDNSIKCDKYTIYYASKTLQELAAYMMEQGLITEHLQVCDMFDAVDRTELAHQVMKLSGIMGNTTVHEVEEVKK